MTTLKEPPSPNQLFHISLNDAQPTTLVLLHSLTSSHREWASITPHLSNYHLLIPDLPRHCKSQNCGPYTLANASKLVAQLIRSHAHNSICHSVGFSAGGFVAVELAHRYPELLESLFVSGVYDMSSRRKLLTVAPYLAVPVQTLQCVLPVWVSSWLSGLDFPPTLLEDIRTNNSFELAKEGFAALLELGKGYQLQCRALAIAGGKEDLVEETREIGAMFSGGNTESRAVVLREGKHGWGIVCPELFADAVKAWVEEKELPEEFESL